MKPTIATARPARGLLSATDYDVIIVGGGSAGLSAALVLGRSMRRVLVCAAGAPRNVTSPAVQGFLTRDCTAPEELLRIGRSQLTPYDSVEVKELRVTAIKKENHHFRVEADTDASRTTVATARKVILATGVEDELPPLDGMREFWGRGVLHCPYCHGWEVRNQPLAIYGRGKTVTGLALLVSRWSDQLTVCTDGPGHLTANARRRLHQQGVAVREEPVRRLVGNPDGMLRCVEFEEGEPLECHALFLHPHQHQRAPFAAQLGCRFTSKGAVWVDKKQQTSVANLYAAGDLTPGQQQAIMAAAEGSKAAIIINEQLTREECPK